MSVLTRLTPVVALVLTFLAAGQAQEHRRFNPVIGLLEKNQPVFGLHTPSTGGGRGGSATATKSLQELAKDALAFPSADFLYDDHMEGGVDAGLPAFADFVKATATVGPVRK